MKYLAIILILILSATTLIAQPGLPSPPSQAPLHTGLFLLVSIISGFGLRVWFGRSKDKQ